MADLKEDLKGILHQSYVRITLTCLHRVLADDMNLYQCKIENGSLVHCNIKFEHEELPEDDLSEGDLSDEDRSD